MRVGQGNKPTESHVGSCPCASYPAGPHGILSQKAPKAHAQEEAQEDAPTHAVSTSQQITI
jgi:hypothetical protein